ncbi:MAG: hypothetical protein JKY50_19115 [Oleispira sp.]|nr:hypothetical protein [Oleispira sp.]
MVNVYVPAWWLRSKVLIQRIWGWSPIEEALLLELSKNDGDFDTLSPRLNLPRQVISSAMTRLMDFGLVEAKMTGQPAFVVSPAGRAAIRDGRALPETSTDRSVIVSMVLTEIGNTICRKRDVWTVHKSQKIDRSTILLPTPENYKGPEAEDLTERLGELITLRSGEWARGLIGGTFSIRPVYISVDADSDSIYGLPDNASLSLKRAISDVAKRKKPTIPPTTLKSKEGLAQPLEIQFDPSDIIVGGEEHLECFERMVSCAKRHIFILSTFIADFESAKDKERFERVCVALENAISRGVHCFLFYGSSLDRERKHAAALKKLFERLEISSLRRGFVHPFYDSVHSHAKIFIMDDGQDNYVSCVGSCNWFQSPFASVEASVLLRDPAGNALIMKTLKDILVKSSGPDRAISDLRMTAKECERGHQGLLLAAAKQNRSSLALVRILGTQDHERIIRMAAHTANERFICGSNRLGSTVVPGVLHPAEAAANKVPDVRIGYSRIHKPLQKKHMRGHRERLRDGIDFKPLRSPQMHAKFLIWDNDDVVITSMNWASASARPNDILDEIGIHLHMPGLGNETLKKLEAILPQLKS